MKFNGFVLILFLSVFIQSCIEKELDFDSIKTQKWNSEWALPLINSTLTLSDLLTDTTGIIQEDEDGLITLVYESEELISINADEIVEIPDQEDFVNESFDLPSLPPGISAQIPVVFSFPFELSEPGQKIDSAILKTGMYSFTVRTDINKNVAIVDFTIPNIINTATDDTLKFTFDLSYQQGINEIVRDTVIDLSNYTLVFENTLGQTNELYINALITFESDNNPNNSPYYISLENELKDMEFSRFFGYLGCQVIEMQDTVNLNIFSINEEGFFSFGEGSVNFQIDILNSFGLPVMLDIITFRAYHVGSNPDSIDIFIFGEGNPSIIELNYPNLNQVGENILTQVNTENSNIHEALEISPGKIFVDIDGHLNPDEDSTLTNFVLDTSGIKVDISFELELFGAVNGFKIADTVDFHLGDIEEIKSLLFVVDVANGFPVNAIIQFNFVDSVYNVVHSLLPPEEQLIMAAPVSSPPEYRVLYPAEKITNIVLNDEELRAISEAKEIIINATLSTTNGQLVKIYSDYNIVLKLGAKVCISL